MNIETLLYVEIEDKFNKLKDMEVGTDEYKTTVDCLTKLVDRAIEIEKLNIESEEKAKDRAIAIEKLNIENEAKAKERENENSLKLEQMKEEQNNNSVQNFAKLKQMKEERKNNIVQNCIAVASIVVSTALTVWGTKASFKFEETGTVTTIMGRGFINKLLPRK